jgi:deoxyribodipyrimidine photolyase
MKIESQQDLFPQSSSQSTWPTREEALQKFQNFNPSRYAKTRNFLNGHISQMSPHIKHGVIQNRELLNIIQDKFNWPGEIFGEAMPTITPINCGRMWKNTKQVSNPTTI